MDWLEGLILGIIQGLTEFLPVSSSGHLEIGKALLGIEPTEDMSFTIAVHGATVLSTIVVFRNDIWQLLKEFFRFKWNEEMQYIAKIAISVIPVGIVGLFFKDKIEALFDSNMLLVGSMLIITAVLLALTYYSPEKKKEITFVNAFIIGIAQAIAVLPGISRSGATIAVALIAGTKKDVATRFSFLMVLIPIIGANIKDIADHSSSATEITEYTAIIVGSIAAFIFGLIACKLMLNIVRKGKLIYFSVYCAIVGIIAITASLL